ncbi:phosphatase 2C-like domain-containing protein [Mrakia frigida]|uniref:type 2C protein phosphatase PTC6 n=1 Tax=Mrakia frigida TaxID=29902 RepID=UPI003FCBF714
MRASTSVSCWRCVSFAEEKAGTVLPVRVRGSLLGGGGEASSCSRITPPPSSSSSNKTCKIKPPPPRRLSFPPSASTLPRRSFSTITPLHSAASFTPKLRRSLTTYVRGESPTGLNLRYPLSASKLIGVYQTRGQRSYQEDAVLAVALQLPPLELQASLRSATESGTRPRKFGEKREMARGWEIQAGTAGEVATFGIFDGHGGVEVSTWLKDNLAETIEEAKLEEAADVVKYMQGLGGYFRRFKGGMLSSRLNAQPSSSNSRQPPPLMTLAERATIAFLKADRTILETLPLSERCGSTASLAFLHSLDFPSAPFFQARRLSITIAHCGDTRILLCQTIDGSAIPLTEKHHAEARVEAARLRRFGMGAGGSVVDAFGESRWMGAVENTRSMGDGRWKPTGVTSEPQVTSRVIDGTAHAFLIFVTDGISATISDQEIIDLCRTSATPALAARTVVNFASDAGSEDNCSVMVVPLAGWGKIGGVDQTRERRDWRRKEVEDAMGRDRRGGGG